MHKFRYIEELESTANSQQSTRVIEFIQTHATSLCNKLSHKLQLVVTFLLCSDSHKYSILLLLMNINSKQNAACNRANIWHAFGILLQAIICLQAHSDKHSHRNLCSCPTWAAADRQVGNTNKNLCESMYVNM